MKSYRPIRAVVLEEPLDSFRTKMSNAHGPKDYLIDGSALPRHSFVHTRSGLVATTQLTTATSNSTTSIMRAQLANPLDNEW